MWKCPRCGEMFQDIDKKCWACGHERPEEIFLGSLLESVRKSLCTVHEEGRVIVFSLNLDSITINESKQLKEGFSEMLAKGRVNMVFDLSGTTFIPSVVVGTIVVMCKEAREAGGDVAICGVTEQVSKVFEITHLNTVFKIFEDRKKAIEYFRPRSSIG